MRRRTFLQTTSLLGVAAASQAK
ncbi:MAG: hypothetical protein RL246_2112, partial [Bacteroidota bacterium]